MHRFCCILYEIRRVIKIYRKHPVDLQWTLHLHALHEVRTNIINKGKNSKSENCGHVIEIKKIELTFYTKWVHMLLKLNRFVLNRFSLSHLKSCRHLLWLEIMFFVVEILRVEIFKWCISTIYINKTGKHLYYINDVTSQNQ